jgi:hypothetical protein
MRSAVLSLLLVPPGQLSRSCVIATLSDGGCSLVSLATASLERRKGLAIAPESDCPGRVVASATGRVRVGGMQLVNGVRQFKPMQPACGNPRKALQRVRRSKAGWRAV